MAKKSFTPNMSTKDMMDYDKRRGYGDVDLFANPTVVSSKKPWQNPDGTHKAQTEEENTMQGTKKANEILKAAMRLPDGEKFGKPVAEKREGETEFERQIRHYVSEAKENPEKYPGGRKQAIAIAAHEAGVAKKAAFSPTKSPAAQAASREATERRHARAQGAKERRIQEHYMTRKGDFSPLDGKLEGLQKFAPVGGGAAPAPQMGGAVPAQAPAAPGMGMTPPSVPPSPPGPGVVPPQAAPQQAQIMRSAADEGDDDELADKLFGKSFVMPDPAKAREDFLKSLDVNYIKMRKSLVADYEQMQKALNSKSIHVLPPRGPYDPFNVQRTATTIPVTKAALTENGTAVLRAETVYKSCATHGITYRADSGCHPCSVYKSMTCKKCGEMMQKTAGGVLACSHGH